METTLNQLIDLLDQATALYRSLLIALRRERDALTNASVRKLDEARQEKQNLACRLESLEEERSRLLARLGEALGCTHPELNLTRLVQLVEGPHAARLQTCRSNLSDLVPAVRQANQHNQLLFRHALELVRGSYHMLNHLVTASPVYYRTGDMQRCEPTGRFLMGEI
ncbi:MAG: flagellar protein FlgN [Desulfobacterales bacterium]|nr:MAG: flagellar protein FlgN [Desulfobacterales bacterium]